MVEVLRKVGVEVIGMVAIFTYGFDIAEKAFSAAGVRYTTLTNYNTLIELAAEKGIVSAEEQKTLLNWRQDPANWNVI